MGSRSTSSRSKKKRPRDLGRVWRNLRDILRVARPHWKPMAAAFGLMFMQSAMDTGRLLVLIPIMTKVFDLQQIKTQTLEEGGHDIGTVAEATKELEKRSVAAWINGLTDTLNGMTQAWVPQSWIAVTRAKAGAETDEANPARGPPPLTPEEVEKIESRSRERFATLFSVLLIFSVMLVLMCGATFGESYLSQYAQLNILMDVRESITRRMLRQGMGYFDKNPQGELVQRVLGDVSGYATGLDLIFSMVRVGFKLILPLIVLAALSPQLMISLLFILPIFIPMRQLLRRILKRSHRRQEQTALRTQVLLQVFSGIRVVKAFNSEDARAKEFRDTDEEVTRLAMRVQKAKSTANALITFMNNFLTVMLFVGGSFLLLRNIVDVAPATLILFAFLLTNMYQPIKRFTKQLNQLTDAMASIERTTEVLNLPDAMKDREGAVTFPGLDKIVEFKDVGFSYEPGVPVLQDIDFAIHKGATVALVGPSGAGKSTICDLMLRFHDPKEGQITIDGKELDGFTRSTFLNRVGVVTQTPFLFHTTIRENIRQGNPNATNAEIEAAAKAAYIHEDILAMTRGYDEVVGDQGVRLSGGQRQRITIARALIRDPDLLVLDEATASLDAASEKAVQAALDELREGRTTLVVAHRLSTIRAADLILVMDEGRIIERGNHEELVAKKGLYARLVEMQDLSPSSRDAFEDLNDAE